MRRLVLAAVAVVGLLAPPGASAQDARTPVVGGGSYNDAPLLEPGRFRDTVLPGERLFYGFELEAGQRLHVGAELAGISDDELKDVAEQWAVGIETPLREVEVLDLIDEDVTGNGTTTPSGSARIEFVSVPALTASAAREEEQTYRGPGTWYVSVFAATTDDEPVRRELPLNLDVTVEGQPQPDPDPEPTPAEATPAPDSGGDDDGGGASLATVLGLGVAGLAVGLVGGAAVGRRRGRG